ncbi:MAG TPA: hypothetical protein EYH39_04615 [Desulfurobacteriaceae bacterium]|nr:hypothetical protein [Desulfurobacteriaceae bacterium]
MKVLPLLGKEILSDKRKMEILEEFIKKYPDAYFLLEDDIALYEFLEKLKFKDDSLFLKFKIAKDILFSQLQVFYKEQKYKTLRKLLEAIPEAEKDKAQILIKGASSFLHEFYELLQNLIYLFLDIDIKTAEEALILSRIEKFEKNKENLEKLIKTIYNNIASKNFGELKFIQTIFLNNLQKILKILKSLKENMPTLSVMATKKAGKSVLINCILGDEYVPSSLELPTPNIVRFVPWENDFIKLIIHRKSGSQEYHFKKPQELKEFLRKLYESAKEKRIALADMTVYYKSKLNFILVDTPGPNYVAATSHKILTYKWIEKSDSIIFLIDYSKHLTEDEISFLKHIYSSFKSRKKLFSLIFAINKIDLIYEEEENKSIQRVIDFIKSRLKSLGFLENLTFAISARQYLEALKLKKFMEENKIDDIYVALKEYKKVSKESVKYLKGILSIYEDYLDMDEVDIDTILKGSFVPFLLSYTQKILKTKIFYQSIYNKILTIQNLIKELENEIYPYLNYSETQKEALEKKLKELIEFSNKKKQEVKETIRGIQRELLKKAFTIIENYSNKLTDLLYEEILHWFNTYKNMDLEKFKEKLQTKVAKSIDELIVEYTKKTSEELIYLLDEYINIFEKTYNKFIREIFSNFNEKLHLPFQRPVLKYDKNYLKKISVMDKLEQILEEAGQVKVKKKVIEEEQGQMTKERVPKVIEKMIFGGVDEEKLRQKIQEIFKDGYEKIQKKEFERLTSLIISEIDKNFNQILDRMESRLNLLEKVYMQKLKKVEKNEILFKFLKNQVDILNNELKKVIS